MIPELGHFALILAGWFAVALAVSAAAGVFLRREAWMRLGGNLVGAMFAFTLLSFACLAYAFLTDDFSVAYVARNSNSLLPAVYKLSAVWGAHEGSFLLWTLIMCGWTLAVAAGGGSLPLAMHARVLSVMGALTAAFVAFLLLTSNPFERLLPLPPADGNDLNPLLQDFGLIIHPPMLYAGYVGLSVPFAFAVAALWGGRLDAAWARWSRPWANVAWAFLTIGIALGSWWAYYELGWGGWWFWDPVENASFMPWLVATALLHSLAVTEKRGVFRSWTVLLALTAFSLSLLGGFIVRSGVLTSVHAFAVDPERGLFILGFLGIVVGGSLLLYALRAPVIRSRASYEGLSREVLLLLNNVLFLVATAAVLLGTLLPLAYEAATGGEKISIGPPYFNFVFVPLMAAVALLLGLAPAARWKRTQAVPLLRSLLPAALAALLVGVLSSLLLAGTLHWQVLMAVAIGGWIALAHTADATARTRATRQRPPAAYAGMTVAHLGFAMTLVGVCVTSHLSSERDVRMQPGQSVEVGDMTFDFEGVENVSGPNYRADRGRIRVTDAGGDTFVLAPEKRLYLAGGSVMTEAAIDAGFFGDTYVALGEPLDGGAWSVRIHVKPFVRWVWFGAVLMALGGIVAALDARYRGLRVRQAAAAVAVPR
jgi:cytochrome c-type biogenesis protein CcmF